MTVLSLKELQICGNKTEARHLPAQFREMAIRAGLAGNDIAERIAEEAAQALEEIAKEIDESYDTIIGLEDDLEAERRKVKELEAEL